MKRTLSISAALWVGLATAAAAFETRPFMVGVYTLSPEDGDAGESDAPATTFEVGVGEVFTLPAPVAAGRTPADRILPMNDSVMGLSLQFTQDTTLGFSSYLGLGVGATSSSLEADGVDDAQTAYEFSLGVRAPVATGAEVDLGYRLTDETPASDRTAGEDADARHDFMVGVRYSF